MPMQHIIDRPRWEAGQRTTREDIHNALGYLGLGAGRTDLTNVRFFLIGGANLVMRGIRDTAPDIDMLVSDDIFSGLSAHPEARKKTPPYPAINRGAKNTSVEIDYGLHMPVSATDRLGDGNYPLSFETHRDEVEFIEGLPCLRLPHVVASKVALHRPQDIVDIRLVADFFASKA